MLSGYLGLVVEARPWTGHLTVGSGWALFVGQAGENELHEHQAIQLCVSGGAPIRVRPVSGETVSGQAVAVATRASHAIDAVDGPLAFLYVEPEGGEGRRLARALERTALSPAASRGVESLRLAIGSTNPEAMELEDAAVLRDRILALWLSPEGEGAAGSAEAIDSRVEKARWIIRCRLTEGRISAEDVAREVRLSPSRLAALFRQETGVPLRAFVLWARLQKAVEAVASGRSLTEAALEAGFSDAAHLARTFRRMFGTTLSQGVGQLRIEVVGS